MKKEFIWPIIIGIMTLFLGQGVLSRIMYKPSFSYELLPVYRLDQEEIHSIILKNTGRVMLHNAMVSISSNNSLTKMRIEGPEVIDSSGLSYITKGTIGSGSIQLTFGRLLAKSNYPITFQTSKNSEINIVVASDETEAKKVIVNASTKSFDYIVIVFSALSTGLVSFYLFKLRLFC